MLKVLKIEQQFIHPLFAEQQATNLSPEEIS